MARIASRRNSCHRGSQAMSDLELSCDAKVPDLPEVVITRCEADAEPPDGADRARGASRDPVEALRLCQHHYRVVQTDRDERLNMIVEVAYGLGLRLRHDPDALRRLIEEPLFRERPRPPN